MTCRFPDLCHHYSYGSSSGSFQRSVKISNVVAHHLPEVSHFFHLSHDFELRIQVGRSIRKLTEQLRIGDYVWSDPQYFSDVYEDAGLDLQFWSSNGHYYGGWKCTLRSLVDHTLKCDDSPCEEHGTRTWQAIIRRPLAGASFYRQVGADVEFTLSVTTPMSGKLARTSSILSLHSKKEVFAASDLTSNAYETDVPHLGAHLAVDIAVSNLKQVAKEFSQVTQSNILAALKSLLIKVEALSRLVEPFAQIHISTKLAFYTLKGAVGVILAQMDRDSRMVSLIDTIADVYNLILDRPFFNVASVEAVVKDLATQTLECSHFILEYFRQSFGERQWRYLASNIDRAIAGYEQSFRGLGERLKTRVEFATAKTVVRTLGRVEDVAMNIDLNDMPYASDARYDRSHVDFSSCDAMVLQKICQWVNSSNGSEESVLLLTGLGSPPEATLSHTVAHFFDYFERLGSSFFFGNTVETKYMFTTIARDLADLDDGLRATLYRIIKRRRCVRRTSSILEQFQEFVVPCFPPPSPASCVNVGPILIVLDRLDQCSVIGSKQRQAILTILAKEVPKLSSNVKFLVTSSRDEDIIQALRNQPHVREMYV
ncbi:hypothetical protein CONPUDRAFT_165362 [Coniophora puteana RWD-64-598 SS2]|uniref:Nephrocystin 3-like N-terminal domain-containing protein n=1 Tax=Coniophora puteana (strain RWD-64-598) TaxID=741705 RepID=A0A5M3MQ13_CONPW|nr:uncharacterized protein CONPUDRAFT_165362 [Coniophora puteana RWD-64-598 SS2]EIW81146.1 hypothetical protein CONPUDRAFT_165362 [Coniophora puteana RWD-64-598 SS2]